MEAPHGIRSLFSCPPIKVTDIYILPVVLRSRHSGTARHFMQMTAAGQKICPLPISDRRFCKRRLAAGGEGGIRTLEPLLTVTRFPIARARPTTRLLRLVGIIIRFAPGFSPEALDYYIISFFKNQYRISKKSKNLCRRAAALNSPLQLPLFSYIILLHTKITGGAP